MHRKPIGKNANHIFPHEEEWDNEPEDNRLYKRRTRRLENLFLLGDEFLEDIGSPGEAKYLREINRELKTT